MSRYDRVRERGRFLGIAAVVLVFAAPFYRFAHVSNNALIATNYDTQRSR